jgi:hypothetical protein
MKRRSLSLLFAGLIFICVAARPAARYVGAAALTARAGVEEVVGVSIFWLRDRLGERPRQRLARVVRRELRRFVHLG